MEFTLMFDRQRNSEAAREAWRDGRAATRCHRCQVRSHSICGAVDGGDLDRLDALAHRGKYAGQQRIFSQGDPPGFVYVITSGVANIDKVQPKGRRQIVQFAIPGDLLGLSITAGGDYGASAITGVAACRFSLKAFSQFASERRSVFRSLYGHVAREIEAAQEQVRMLGASMAAARVAWFLLAMEKRWARIAGNRTEFPLPMTRDDIGCFLGLSLETVSRTMSEFARRGLIVFSRRNLRILDCGELRKISGC